MTAARATKLGDKRNKLKVSVSVSVLNVFSIQLLIRTITMPLFTYPPP
ncbi:Purine-cytosine permease [Venturia inaequalis]|nr:Purine-cytosine permease [Venturia inaequalis]